MNKVESFLHNNTPVSGTGDDLASACDAYIRSVAGTSLKQAVKLSLLFVKRSGQYKGSLPAMAYRTLARNYHMSGQYDNAHDAYLTARKLNSKNKRVVALIDRAMIDLYMYLGDTKEAKRRAKLALKTFETLQADDDIAKTKVNYANLLHRQDLHREAEKLYKEAADFFEQIDQPLAVARCYYNRANTLVQLFRFDEAEKLFIQSKRIYDKHKQLLDATDAEYGLAWLHMLRGEYHPALLELERTEKIYTTAGQPKGAALCHLDRAELLLALRLYDDALDTASTAVKQFRKLKIRYETAKAYYFKAQAAFAIEKKQQAKTALSKAYELFSIENNYGFVGACLLLKARMENKLPAKKKILSSAMKQFTKGQLPLWEAICGLEIAEVENLSLKQLQTFSKNPVMKSVPFLFANWQTLLGDKAIHQNQPASAKKYWQQAADRIDAIRNQLPPVEYRTGYNKLEKSPHLKLVEYELPVNPHLASAWAERFQTAGTWMPLKNITATASKVEESLSRLSQQVMALHRQTFSRTDRHLQPQQTDKQVKALQNQIRQELTHLEQTASISYSVDFLKDRFLKISKEKPVVQFLTMDQDIVAFIYQNKNMRYHRYSNGREILDNFLRQWRFLMEKEQLTGADKGSTQDPGERIFLEKLGDWLWKPLELNSGYTDILLLTGSALANVPWQGLIIDNNYLSDSVQLLLAPSLRHYLKARDVTLASDKKMLFAGDTEKLPMVKSEIQYLKKMSGQNTETFLSSNRSDWPSSGEYALWHYAGHASLRKDNPFYSYLDLADGPLFATDFRLRSSKVNLVVLSACRTAEQAASVGEEPGGLVRSLLEMGAKNIIAGQWPVSDTTTLAWMKQFYKKYLNGSSVKESVSYAIQQTRKKYTSVYHWGPFVVYGSGD